MAKCNTQTSAKPRSETKIRSKVKRAKPVVHHHTGAQVEAGCVVALLNRPRGATIAAIIEAIGLAVPFGARLSGRGGAQEARADAGIRAGGRRAGLS
jgi:hypothetical protein